MVCKEKEKCDIHSSNEINILSRYMGEKKKNV